MLADILSPLVDAATNVINALGLPGVFVLMTAESACIPIPSEAIMLFAGFNVSEGNMTLFGIVAAGVLGNLVGSLIAYGVGYYGRIELLDRNRLIHINRRHLEQADRWFERHGSATVFFSDSAGPAKVGAAASYDGLNVPISGVGDNQRHLFFRFDSGASGTSGTSTSFVNVTATAAP